MDTFYPIPRRIPRRLFHQKLKQNKEDMQLINEAESLILKRRPYTFRMPKPGSSVVLLLSGGMDSIVAWAMLMGVYKLHVYPLVVSHALLDAPLMSVRFFSRYYKKRYSDLFHKPYITRAPFLDGQFQKNLALSRMSPETVLDMYDSGMNMLHLPFRGSNIFTSVFGLLYGQYLSLIGGKQVTTVIYGATADDGGHIPSQTYAFMRLMMLMLMKFVQADTIQFGSVFYESSLGAWMNKREVLAWGNAAHLPLEKTYSCDLRGLFHCGTCLSCQSRRYCFDKAGVADKTWYMSNLYPREVVRRMKQKIRVYRNTKRAA